MAQGITTTKALMQFFATDDLPTGTGPARPLTNGELMALRREDRAGYDLLGAMAATELGMEIEVAPATA